MEKLANSALSKSAVERLTGPNPVAATEYILEEKGEEMRYSEIEILTERYNRLLRNGRNAEMNGLMRKLRRKIAKAKQGIILS